MDALTFVIICSSVSLTLARADEFHLRLPDEDLVHYFGTNLRQNVPKYELVMPQKLRDAREKSDVNHQTEVMKYHLSAFGEEYHLDLKPNTNLLRGGCLVYKMNGERKNLLPCSSQQCYYFGSSLQHNGSRVAVSTCNGLHGVISVPDHELVVQPLRENNLHLLGQQTGLEKPHLVYKRTMTPSGYKPDSASHFLSIRHRRVRRSLTNKYIELIAVVGPEMAKYHGEDTRRFTLTSINVAASRLADPTIGVTLEMAVKQITILEKTPDDLEITEDVDATLSSFCQWQENTIPTQDKNHFDIAALLVRTDLKKKGNFATTGLAYNNGMCTPGQRCIVCEDNGVNIGFTIAHETGHALGMTHDGEENTCQNGQNVMSSGGGRGPSGFKWSSCSRESLSSFLRKSKSSCLNNLPTIKRKVDDLNVKPGLVYSITDQCRIAYGEGSEHCPEGSELWKRYGDDMCARLTCYDPNRPGYCTAGSAPVLDGTECGGSSWCIEGRCVPYDNDAPEPVDGGWTGWEQEWSECSRTCGGGTRLKRRSCTDPSPRFGGEICHGESVIAELCNMMACVVSEQQFKDEQCASTDSQLFNGARHHWTPANGVSGDQQCSMFCSMDGTMITLQRSDHYQDGTECNGVGSYNKCLDGKCKAFGCDGKMDSGRLTDKCGVCSGHNDTCRSIKGQFNGGKAKEFVTFLSIPQGSTGITVSNDNAYSFLSVVVNGRRIFAKKNRKALYGQYSDSGLSVQYTGRPEKMYIAGPVQSMTEIQVFRLYGDDYQGTAPDIKYEYFVGMSRSLTSNYIWKTSLGPCSVSCGGGSTVRTINCVEVGSETIAEEYLCNLREKPSVGRQQCNTQSCPPSWQSGDYSACSKSCGGGVKTRLVECVQVDNGKEKILAEENCLQPKPLQTTPCNVQQCPGYWHTGEWSTCSVSCAKGTQTRRITCVRSEEERTEVDAGQCSSQKPEAVGSCMEGPCFPDKTGENCKDAAQCSDYGDSVCNGEYKAWAEQNCMQFCGFCVVDTKHSLNLTPAACDDTTDCKSYGRSVCTGYREWSEQNCKNFCGFCVLPNESTKTALHGDIHVEDSSTTRQPTTVLSTQVSATTKSIQCIDTIENCNAYGKSSCTQYREWASLNCKLFCGFCGNVDDTTQRSTTVSTTSVSTTTETAELIDESNNCVDANGDCSGYGKGVCSEYKEWAQLNCQHYCEFCTSGTEVATTLPTTVTVPQTSTEHCQDTNEDCKAYGRIVCTNYRDWSLLNCKQYCGFCQQTDIRTTLPTTTTTTTTTIRTTLQASTESATRDGCKDAEADCEAYGKNVCTNYKEWAKLNCKQYCGFCSQEVRTTLPPTTTTSTTLQTPTVIIQMEGCKDIETDCKAYGPRVCTDYRDWANLNCKQYCGFCSQKPCTDNIDNCSAYGQGVCDSYRDWARLNCQKFCKFCNEA